MKNLLLCGLLALPLDGALRGQSATEDLSLAMLLPPAGDTTETAATVPKRKLLPDNMSWLERDLWGENGLVRSIAIASPLTPEVRKGELQVRRTMLTMHQIGGFLTVGLIGTTLYYGQMSLSNPQIRSYRSSHQTFVTLSIFSYGATGALAILSPPPLIRRDDETSTTTIHKMLAWVHFAGMVVTPILGASLKRSFQYDKLARYHQISGYITGGTLLASLIIVTF